MCKRNAHLGSDDVLIDEHDVRTPLRDHVRVRHCAISVEHDIDGDHGCTRRCAPEVVAAGTEQDLVGVLTVELEDLAGRLRTSTAWLSTALC